MIAEQNEHINKRKKCCALWFYREKEREMGIMVADRTEPTTPVDGRWTRTMGTHWITMCVCVCL